jgi:hypothetical protein
MATRIPFPRVGGREAVGWFRAHARELGAEAIDDLYCVAVEGSVELRAAALLALAEIAPGASEAFVITRLAGDTSEEVRDAGTRALGIMTGIASIEWLRHAKDDTAYKALRKRLELWTSRDLERAVWEALESRPDQVAVIGLEVLAVRREPCTELLLSVVQTSPHLLTHTSINLAVQVSAERQDELLSLIAARAQRAPNDSVGQLLAQMAIHMNPDRVFTHFAPIVRSGRGATARGTVSMLLDQVHAAWTREQGFDALDSPIAAVPDARWCAVLSAPSDALAASVDVLHANNAAACAEDNVLPELLRALTWTHAACSRDSELIRSLQSGAEDGTAFVIAGFDVSEIAEPLSLAQAQALALKLSTLLPRAETNLHYITHQCGGHACRQYTLIGIPLGSPGLSSTFAPASPAVELLLKEFPSWGSRGEELNGSSLQALHSLFSKCVPNLPVLVDGLEALAWTAPGEDFTDALEGLQVVSVLPKCRPWSKELGEVEHCALRERGSFTQNHQRLLAQLGKQLGLRRTPDAPVDPRIFILWANSD